MRDASVFSEQWMTIPVAIARDVSPEELLRRYCSFLRSVTGTLVRPESSADGVSFRLAGTGISLINFLPPQSGKQNGEQTLSLAICGGLLVQPGSCERGSMTFTVNRDGEEVRLALQITEFCPLILGSNRPSRLRKWLYRLTQASIHRMVTVRFLARFYRELAGTKACIRVVKVRMVEGEPI